MGVEMVTMAAALERSRRGVNWKGLSAAVCAVSSGTLLDTGDDLFWFAPHVPDDVGPGARWSFHGLREVRGDLFTAAAMVRTEMQAARDTELLRLDLPDQLIWVTGGASAGDDPTEVLNALYKLAAADVLRAGGLSSWTDYGHKPAVKRRLRFTPKQRRAIRAGEAAGHALEVATQLSTAAADAAGVEWWLDLIMTSRRGPPLGKATMQLAARLLTTAAWLRDPARSRDPDLLEKLTLEALSSIDEQPVSRFPSWSSPENAMYALTDELEGYEGWFRDVTGGDEALSDALVKDVAPRVLTTLADHHCDRLWRATGLAPPEIGEGSLDGRRRKISHVREVLRVVAVDSTVDWNAMTAAHVAAAGDPEDVNAVYSIIDGCPDRYATTTELGSVSLLIAEPRARAGDVATAVDRLTRTGAFDAGGALWWPSREKRLAATRPARRTGRR